MTLPLSHQADQQALAISQLREAQLARQLEASSRQCSPQLLLPLRALAQAKQERRQQQGSAPMRRPVA